MKTFRKRTCKKQYSLNVYFSLISKIVLFIILLVIFSNFKPLIIILIFELLDFFKVIFKQFFPYIPVDFVFVFGLTASYYYGFVYGLIIFCLGIINRAILSCLELRHLTKAIRHLPIFYLSTIFRGISFFNNNFFYVAFTLLCLNYLLKYGFKIARADLDFEKTPFHVINFFLAIIVFYLISMIYFYLPFLK
ncbi:MAG: hypothetical protein QW757_02595 [Candidatus Woesearchaeota archaeon]